MLRLKDYRCLAQDYRGKFHLPPSSAQCFHYPMLPPSSPVKRRHVFPGPGLSMDQPWPTGPGKAGRELVLQLVLKMLCIFLPVVHHLHEKTVYGLPLVPGGGDKDVRNRAAYTNGPSKSPWRIECLS